MRGWQRMWRAAMAGGLIACLGGCTSDDEQAARPRAISLAQFSRSIEVEPFPETAEAASGAKTGDETAAEAGDSADGSPDGAVQNDGDAAPIAPLAGHDNDGPGGARETAGDEPADASPVLADEVRPGERVLIDSLIGQVNGRPIFAHDVLDPIEGQLRAIARNARTERELQAARRQFAEVVGERFFAIVESELLLADAESEQSEQQRQGLLYALTQFKKEIVRKFGAGSQSQTEERLREEGAAESLEEYVGAMRDEELIREQLRKKVRDRVIVSWRDVEREYERRRDEFNPPPSMDIGTLVLVNDDAEDIEYVTERLAAGDSFDSLPDRFNRNRMTYSLNDAGEPNLSTEALRAAAMALAPGETSAPIVGTSVTVWVHLYGANRPNPASLYDRDIQFQVRDGLRTRRLIMENEKYRRSLMSEEENKSLASMEQRLLEIAWRRYYR